MYEAIGPGMWASAPTPLSTGVPSKWSIESSPDPIAIPDATCTSSADMPSPAPSTPPCPLAKASSEDECSRECKARREEIV